MECLTMLRSLSYDINLWLPLCPSAEEAYEQIMIIWDKAEVIKVSDNALEHLEVPRGDKGCRYCTKVLQVLLVQRLSAASFGVGGLPGNLVCGGGLGEGWGWF